MRETWPVEAKEKLLADIEEADTSSRAARLERLEFLIAEFGPPADDSSRIIVGRG
jgi:hypothetical protein